MVWRMNQWELQERDHPTHMQVFRTQQVIHWIQFVCAKDVFTESGGQDY